MKKTELEQKHGVEVPFVFHGGETTKFRGNTNLFDVLQLGTKRIGHGINLAKHSYLMDEIRDK